MSLLLNNISKDRCVLNLVSRWQKQSKVMFSKIGLVEFRSLLQRGCLENYNENNLNKVSTSKSNLDNMLSD